MPIPGKPIKVSAAEVRGYEERVDRHLEAVETRLRMRGREANFCTPDLALIMKESGGDVRSEAEKFFDGVLEGRLEMLQRIMQFIAGKGPDPRRVVQRFYAIAVALFPELVMNMSKADLARMLDERKASMSWRGKQIFQREAGTWEPGSRGVETRGANARAVQRRHDGNNARNPKKVPHEKPTKSTRRPGKKAGPESHPEAGRKNGSALARETVPRGLAAAGAAQVAA